MSRIARFTSPPKKAAPPSSTNQSKNSQARKPTNVISEVGTVPSDKHGKPPTSPVRKGAKDTGKGTQFGQSKTMDAVQTKGARQNGIVSKTNGVGERKSPMDSMTDTKSSTSMNNRESSIPTPSVRTTSLASNRASGRGRAKDMSLNIGDERVVGKQTQITSGRAKIQSLATAKNTKLNAKPNSGLQTEPLPAIKKNLVNSATFVKGPKSPPMKKLTHHNYVDINDDYAMVAESDSDNYAKINDDDVLSDLNDDAARIAQHTYVELDDIGIDVDSRASPSEINDPRFIPIATSPSKHTYWELEDLSKIINPDDREYSNDSIKSDLQGFPSFTGKSPNESLTLDSGGFPKLGGKSQGKSQGNSLGKHTHKLYVEVEIPPKGLIKAPVIKSTEEDEEDEDLTPELPVVSTDADDEDDESEFIPQDVNRVGNLLFQL